VSHALFGGVMQRRRRRMRWNRLLAWAAVAALWPGSLAADRLPEPPCSAAPSPAPAALGAPPAVQVARRGDRALHWPPPGCTGWHGDGFRMVVALAGRFRLVGGIGALLARFGAVSKLPEMRYWSLDDRRWEPFVTAAHALDGPRGASRPDFAPDELRGDPRFYSERGTFASGAVTYRMDVREANAERLVVTVENTGTMRILLLDLFDPGELQSLYVLEHEAGDVWTYYTLTRTRDTASALTEGHEAFYVNRAMAQFRYYAGAPELPLAAWR
jgi:hypothetical protein